MAITASSPTPEPREFSLIVTDSRAFGLTLQQTLARLGSGGQEDQVVPLDQAVSAIQMQSSRIRRVILTLGGDVARGLHFIRQIRSLTPLPILVVGPRDAGLILDAIHAGASDFMEDTDPFDEHLAKALARHEALNAAGAGPGTTIGVASVRGGSGGSVVAVNLAAELIRYAQRTALCDLDLQGGVCDALLNLKPKHTILDLERCLDRLDRNSIEQALTPHASGVHLLSAPASPADIRVSWGDFFPPVLRTIRQLFPVVVADLPRLSVGMDVQTLTAACDKLVIVTQLDFNSVRSAHRILEQLDRGGMPADRIHVVWNRHGQPNELSASKGELALNRQRAHIVPDEPKVVNRSINCGTPFVLDSPETRIAKAIVALADSVAGDLESSAAAQPAMSKPAVQPAVAARGSWSDWVNAAFNRLEFAR